MKLLGALVALLAVLAMASANPEPTRIARPRGPFLPPSWYGGYPQYPGGYYGGYKGVGLGIGLGGFGGLGIGVGLGGFGGYAPWGGWGSYGYRPHYW